MSSFIEMKTSSSARRRRSRAKKSVSKTWSIRAGAFPATNMSFPDNKPYNIVQTVDYGVSLGTSASVPTFLAQTFTLAQLDQYVSLTNVFDQYRIAMIEAWIYPTVIGTTSQEATMEGSVYTSVVDYDDATALTTYNSASDYANAIQTTLACGHYRKFVPHANYTVGSTATAGNVEAPWIDTATATVPHFGIKLACRGTNAVIDINIQARFHVQFRNVR